jgi:D-galactarolactone cycloisomerase
MKRRDLLVSGAAAAGTIPSLLSPVRALAAEVKPVRIRTIETFNIQMPATPAEIEAGVMNRAVVTRVVTESNVRGYSFGGPGDGGFRPGGRGSASAARAGTFPQIRDALVGADLFAVEDHLKKGLINLGGIEEAIWDAIGKVAGQPIYRLLGGSKTSIPVYITAVWRGPMDQSQVPIKDQATYARRLKEAGFTGFKMRIFRPNFMDDVESCAGVIAACGRPPAFKTMVDRTAHIPGKVWDYPTALAAAQALQNAGVHWLEEPFARDDFESAARLAREVDILITGGEGFRGLDAFREALVHETYDILQPDLRNVGGLLTTRKVAAMCEAFHKPCIGHGSYGLGVIGRVQAHAAWGAPLEELALATPPLLPQEQWAPASKILHAKELFSFRDGEILVPQAPGLGLDLDEEAIEHYKV